MEKYAAIELIRIMIIIKNYNGAPLVLTLCGRHVIQLNTSFEVSLPK